MKLKAIFEIKVNPKNPKKCGRDCDFERADYCAGFCEGEGLDRDIVSISSGYRHPACLAATKMAERIQFALETARDTYKYIRDQQTYVDLCDAILKDMEKEDGD